MLRALALACLLPVQALACETALLLAMDVSNSVDPGEYRLQIDGLASALRDPEIAEILVQDRIALSVMQWSGSAHQQISLDWQRMISSAHVTRFANDVRNLQRAFILSDTAPAEALRAALAQMRRAPDCTRKVIDMSGDGTANAGTEIAPFRRRAQRQGITINGLAIEGLGLAMSNYYRRHIITADGFVETARGHRDYARAIHKKILREISRVIGSRSTGIPGNPG
jgi:Ca-activated chloride channel family protein